MTQLPAVIAAALESGQTIVTTTAQRAAAVRLAWAQYQLTASRRVWRSPAVLPFDAWRARCLDHARAHGVRWPRALTLAEETLLWMRAATALTRDGAVPLLQSGALADALRQSARLVADHRIPVEKISADASEEARWLARAMQWVDAEAAGLGASTRWSHRDPTERDAGSDTTWFAGFVSLLPAQTASIEAAVTRGVDCRMLSMQDIACGAAAEPLVRQADDVESELGLAASWCAQLLREDAERRILVVVPELAARRGIAERAFQQQLDPVSAWQGVQSSHRLAFEGGEPLASAPAVAHLLRSLRVLVQSVERDELIRWLRSASHGLASAAERARLEQQAGNLTGRRASLIELLALQATEPSGESSLGGRVLAARSVLPAGSQPAHVWAESFDRMLAALRPPDAAPRDSRAQQTEERWRGLLEEYAGAHAAVGAVSARDAVRELAAIAQRVRFAPASADAAVTVTASLDAPLVAYDAIWVCGLTSNTWPAPPRVDPFVPWYLQREAGVEAASPAGCLALARRQLEAWRSATRMLVLSFAREEDGASRSPSPLLHGFHLERASASRAVLARRIAAVAPDLERYTDGRGRAWSAQRTVPGGSRALTLLNDCPFRAYAELQLGAVERAAAEEGLDRRQRGDLLHAALDELWGLWGGSEGLAAREAPALAADVRRSVQRAAARRLPPGDDPVRARAVARECERAEQLLTALATLERARPAFTVAARESKRGLEIGGLRFDLRIDRLDRFDDGSIAIIDYKSGRNLPRDWFGERPDIVQLLVYLMALHHEPDDEKSPISALATLHLDESAVQFRGYVRSRTLLGDLEELPAGADDWEAQLTRWRASVVVLARRFASGEARVEPRPQACRHCALPVLCRKAQWLEADAGLASFDDLTPSRGEPEAGA